MAGQQGHNSGTKGKPGFQPVTTGKKAPTAGTRAPTPTVRGLGSADREARDTRIAEAFRVGRETRAAAARELREANPDLTHGETEQAQTDTTPGASPRDPTWAEIDAYTTDWTHGIYSWLAANIRHQHRALRPPS